MKSNSQIAILVALLVAAGVGLISYKHLALGFPLFTSESQTVWKIETRLDFKTGGGAVTARINLPEDEPGRQVIFAEQVSPGYDFEFVTRESGEFAQWRTENALPGEHTLYLRSEISFTDPGDEQDRIVVDLKMPPAEGIEADALKNAAEAITQSGSQGGQLVLEILQEINNPASEIFGALLRDRDRRSEKMQLAIDILAHQGIPAKMVRGVVLEDRQSNRSARLLLSVFYEGNWLLFDPRAVLEIPANEFIQFQEGNAALFEVFGGEDSRISFSLVKEQRAVFLNAVENARLHKSWLVDFSIYSLPVAQQSTFKLLLLIPLGALVVVILRNLVGIRTSGTFMPILIALAFLQTTLLTGLLLFVLVVGFGLLVRSYMSRLNLLLVPRIASVLVFVIIIYAAIGIAGNKLGYDWALKVTFFPMIILSWTIERMSILWDEDGPHEVLLQGGGSLLTASLAYLLMSNQTVADAIFLYPEVLLLVLAIIISIGSYSGYRLSELRRFEPMERY